MAYKKVATVLFIFLSLICISSCTCDSAVRSSINAIQNYAQDAYRPKNYVHMHNWLTLLTVIDMKDVYRQCLNRTVVDPAKIYPRSPAECPMALYQIYWLAGNYSAGDVEKFKRDVQKIGKTVFSSYSACVDVLHLNSVANAECIQHIQSSTYTMNAYLDDLDQGGNGTKYLDNLLTIVIQQRRICNINMAFTAPIPIKDDSCTQANRGWLYPLISQQLGELKQIRYSNYTTKLHVMYQMAYRANSICNNKFKSQVKEDAQMINEEQVKPVIEMNLRQQIIEGKETNNQHADVNEIEKHEES